MANKHSPQKRFGGFLFEGYMNPTDAERAENYKGKGRLAVFTKAADKPQSRKPVYMTEAHLRFVLAEFERIAHSGVREGRGIHELFNAVEAGLPLKDVHKKSPFKPQDCFYLLDGMYGGKAQHVEPRVTG
ncbi:MAG: hypothetical protein ACK4VI_03455 [Alphaproteobacteria bacterium]